MCYPVRVAYLTLFGLILFPTLSVRAAPPQFPVVFTSPADLVPYGLFYRPQGSGGRPPANFKTQCFDGGDMLSGEPELFISDELFDRYRAMGFTRDSLCIALSSRATFDPETGRRLPTYILRDQQRIVAGLEDKLREARDGGSLPSGYDSVEAFAVAVAAIKREDFGQFSQEQLYDLLAADRALTWERPLAVPPCFKNATPYLDCEWKFGVTKGRPYREAEKARAFGNAIDRQMKDAMASGKPLGHATLGASEVVLDKFEVRAGAYEGQPEAVKVPEDMWEWEKAIDWIMVSKGLPRGYGYGFLAFRFPDGAFTLNSVDPQKSAEKLDPKSLLDIIKSFF